MSSPWDSIDFGSGLGNDWSSFTGDSSESLNSGIFGSMQDFGGVGNPTDPSGNFDPYVSGNTDFTSGLGSALGGLGQTAGGGALGAGLMAAMPGLVQALGGIGGFTTSQEGIGMTKDLISKADPWGSSGGRGAAGASLMSLLGSGPPSAASVANLPGYQAGLEAVQRAGAAQGFTGSGNMMSALASFGGQEYQQAYGNWLNEVQALSPIAGATVAPGGNSAQLMGILGQAEASKNASIANIAQGTVNAVGNVMKPTQIVGGGGGGGGGGGDGGLGGLIGGALSLFGF